VHALAASRVLDESITTRNDRLHRRPPPMIADRQAQDS